MQPRRICVLLLTLIVVACEAPMPSENNAFDAPVMSAVGLPSTAVMRFGDPATGSPFNPADGHDMSVHAKDKLVPRTVVIAVGGTVTFEVAPVHRVAVYDDGTEPSDISLANLLPAPILGIPNFQIDDANNRLSLQSSAGFLAPRTFSHTFTEPGRFLVICITTPHFVNGDMWGWVIVK
jgi:plastocyanin